MAFWQRSEFDILERDAFFFLLFPLQLVLQTDKSSLKKKDVGLIMATFHSVTMFTTKTEKSTSVVTALLSAMQYNYL